MSTTWDDDAWDAIVDLLTYVAATDRRTIGKTDIRVWLDAARDGDWPSIEFAHRAVIRHRNDHPGVWLEPGHVTQTWRRLRSEASSSFNPDMLAMPREAEQDPAAYRRWITAEGARHRARLTDEFVTGATTSRAIEAAS